MESSIACIGAAHIDRKAFAEGDIAFSSSNPVHVKTSHGGVARNVAENLMRMGLRPSIVSRVGNDRDGDAVLSQLEALGVDTAFASRSDQRATASFTALMNRNGALVIALADMGIYDEIDQDRLQPIMSHLMARNVWFLDCNLPADTIRFLLANKPRGCTVYINGVSTPKSRRLQGNLRGVDVLILNEDEAEGLTRMDIRAPVDVCEAGNRLLSAGAATVVITRGKEGVFLATPSSYDFLPTELVEVKDEIGAGDALIAGLIFGRTTGRPMKESLQIGMAAAALTVGVEETVYTDMTGSKILEAAGVLPSQASA